MSDHPYDEKDGEPVREEKPSAESGNTPEERTSAPAGGEYRSGRPGGGTENFTDASYIPKDQAPNMPRVYSYTDPEPKAEKPEPKKKHRIRAGTVIAMCVFCVILGAAVGILAVQRSGSIRDFFGTPAETAGVQATAAPTPAATGEAKASAGQDTAGDGTVVLSSDSTETASLTANQIYDNACEQVVGITTEVTYTNVFGMPASGAVSGSGVIISSDGYILTNYHVIEYAVEGGYAVEVVLFNGEKYTAEIVGYESDNNDIAVLKIDAEGLTPVTLGNSNDMQVGDTIYVVGNPLGELSYTMTKGMISALDREITTQNQTTGVSSTVNMFQVDAAVNEGNSGGPVYDTEGKVIGVVTAKYSDTGVEGLGFAIPINDAIDIANDLIQNGYVRGKPYMGVKVQTVSSAVAQYYNMVVGAYVYAVSDGSSAADAGVKMGDIITKVGDTEIASVSDLTSAIRAYKAGDTAVLTVYREGQYIELTVVFDEKTPEAAAPETAEPTAGIPEGSYGGYGSYGNNGGLSNGFDSTDSFM